jgi:predicted Zn-dependent peptidase
MKFNKKTLENGLRIITVPMVDNPSVTVLVMVEAGSKYENKTTNGLSHFLEHMVFKGTPRRPKAIDISKELDSIGSHYNAFTTQEFTGYYAKADKRHLDTVIDVVSDMYNNPLFDEEEIKKEKGVIAEEIKMYQDLPQQHVQDVFMELLYGDTPTGWNVAGTVENVKSFTREDFIKYRSQHYLASSTIVVVSGSIDENETIGKIEKAFGNISTDSKSKKAPVIEDQKVPQVKLDFKETDQTHLVMGVRTFSITDKRIPVMLVLSTILGRGMSSRLFAKMRDQLGICYYIRTEHNAFTDHGFLSISAGVDNTRVEEAILGILEECNRLKTEPVLIQELQKAKDYIAGTTMLELETSDARAEYCGYQEVMKKVINLPSEIIEKINKVSSEDILKLANEIFVNEGLNLALVGRSKDNQALSQILHFKS